MSRPDHAPSDYIILTLKLCQLKEEVASTCQAVKQMEKSKNNCDALTAKHKITGSLHFGKSWIK